MRIKIVVCQAVLARLYASDAYEHITAEAKFVSRYLTRI